MDHSGKFVQIIEHELFIIGKRSDDIIHVKFLTNTEITVELQSLLLKNYIEITQGKDSCFIFEGGEFVSITKEARENAILIEKQSPDCASAIIIRNLGQKLIADFYYKVNKPKKPFKVFTDFEKAIEWLKDFKPMNENM